MLTTLWYFKFTSDVGQNMYIGIATLKYLLGNNKQKVKDVSVNYLAETNIEIQETLKKNLKSAGIVFGSYTKGFYIPVCRWRTLVLISKFELDFDLRISGGGCGQFDQFSVHKRKSFEEQICYSAYHFKKRKKKLLVGVIDTGSIPPNMLSKTTVIMNTKMFNTNFKVPRYTEYCDNTFRHGTAIVEILKKNLLPDSRIFVARVGHGKQKNIRATSIILAMEECKRLNVDVINCSFSGRWESE